MAEQKFATDPSLPVSRFINNTLNVFIPANFVDVKSSYDIDDPVSPNNASLSFHDRSSSGSDRLESLLIEGEELALAAVLKTTLRGALRESTDGKAVLHFYKTNGCLNNKMRQRLANLIIDNELKSDPNRIIAHNRFQALSFAIADLFPPEKPESYFTPYCSDSRGKRHNAKGKLLDRYKNMRKGLRACGLIERKHHSTPTKNVQGTSLFAGTVGEQIKWLTKSTEPWTTVERYWANTMEKRLHHFHNDLDSSMNGYLDLYPSLKEPNGYKLINLDFSVKYPESHGAFFDTWSTFTEKILDYCQDKFEKDIKFRLIVQEANVDLFVTDESALKLTAFYLLSLLMPKYQTCKTNSGPPWRPTRDEMKNFLLLNVQTSAEIGEALEKRKLIYSDCNLPVVPIPIIVGPLNNVTSSLVNFGSVSYQLSSPMAAIDLCFKIYQMFNLEFSPETMYAWLFVQKYVYKMSDASVKNYIPVTTLASDLFV